MKNISNPLRVAIIGRTEILYDTALLLAANGYQVKLIITAKAAPEYKKTEQDFEKLANQLKASYIYNPKITAQQISDIEGTNAIDIAISINYSGIIPQEVISLFPLGILNAHGGDLPRYRGNACQAWALLNGESHIGLCIHKMIGGELDSGNIMYKHLYPVNHHTRIQEVLDWFERDIPNFFLHVVRQVAENPDFQGNAQSTIPSDALRCYPRLPEDGKIDWQKSNIEIVRLINASSEPYEGAFCVFEGEKMTIWRASLYEDEENYVAMPGQVAAILSDKGAVVVITGNGKIAIEEVSFQNKRQKPTQFIQSIRKRLK